jgi:hypothetical protein
MLLLAHSVRHALVETRFRWRLIAESLLSIFACFRDSATFNISLTVLLLRLLVGTGTASVGYVVAVFVLAQNLSSAMLFIRCSEKRLLLLWAGGKSLLCGIIFDAREAV